MKPRARGIPWGSSAVYESMLPKQPLRFVLADDPGAGKTIMAGLYIRELIMRADARRILIVAPGGLVDQWRDELFEKFGLEFCIFSHELEAASPSGNPFEDQDHLIVRLDQMSRSDEYQEKVCLPGWDLVIFDEAHKLSAHFYGQEIKRTWRFSLAERLGGRTRHLLLMTATPHNGKEEDFQLFLSDRPPGAARISLKSRASTVPDREPTIVAGAEGVCRAGTCATIALISRPEAPCDRFSPLASRSEPSCS